MDAEEFLREGRLDECLHALQQSVRSRPADARLRVFLFQLLSVLGDWQRAAAQLKVAAELDEANLLLAEIYGIALNCEAFRADVFAGTRSPLVFGEPAEWVAWLVQANQLTAQAEYRAADELRQQAFEAAPASAGSIDGQRFAWIADADTRLGPVLEAIVDGRYYWVPFANIRSIYIEPPTDLRDAVWAGAVFTWTNGGESGGLIPVRYPGSEASEENAVRMARRTEWSEPAGGLYLGLGQRVFATDEAEYALLETRRVMLDQPAAGGAAGEGKDGRTDADGASAAVPAGPPDG